MNREILRLAIPNIISNISVPLLSTVDTALMGRMSALHIGAVGIGSMIFNFIYWNFGFLRMGTTGITAQAYGRKDPAEMILTLARAMLCALVLAALVMLLQTPFARLSFYLMNVNAEQYALVSEYFFIRIWAAPATIGLYAMMGWYFGMQNAIYPLILTIVINIVNIAFSFLFIIQFDMDIDGVAWGTVIAQYCGLLLALGLFFKKYSYLVSDLKTVVLFQVEAFKKFLLINRDIFIRTLCLTFAFAFFYSQSAENGEAILAVNVILLQFFNWMAYGVDGFAFAAESLVGKYAGAGVPKDTRSAIRYSFVWGMLLALLFSFLYGIGHQPLLRIFTDQAAVIDAAQPYIWWIIALPLISTPSFIWDGVYIGLTASKAMRDTMLLSLIVYVGSFYALDSTYGNHGLWLAMLLFMAARGIIQWLFYERKGIELR